MDPKRPSRLPYIEPSIRTIAGTLITALAVFIYTKPEYILVWLGLLLFISINLFQSGLTSFCMMEKFLRFLGFRSELGEIKALSEEAHRSAAIQANYLDTLSLLNEAVIEMTPDGKLISISDGWENLISCNRCFSCIDNSIGKPLLHFIHEDDYPLINDFLNQILISEEKTHSLRFRMKREDGEDQWVGGKFMLQHPDEDELTIKGVLRDITDAYLKEKQITHMAMHDALTGLPNRTLLEEHMDTALANSRRNNDKLAVLFIDLDNFKQVNDVHGHKEGDKLLVAVSSIMRDRIRQVDTLSRWGGDEFVLLLPGMNSSSDLRRIAENLVHRMDEEVRSFNLESMVTFSIGGAMFPDDADGIESLLAQADKALYYAKSQGRNNVQIYSEMREQDIGYNDFDMTQRLSCAVKDNTIQAYYQLIFNAKTQKACGVEALARWHDDKYNWISPEIFIPMAENLGLIDEVSQQVIECAMHDMGQYLTQHPDFYLSVNISARQLQSGQFPDRLNATIREKYGISPEQIKLEITESQLLGTKQCINSLERLRELGFSLSLDDFGRGYSTLSSLEEFPIQELKIDRSFIKRLKQHKSNLLLESIIKLGRELNLTIVAEGIECGECAEKLAAMGIDRMQGYYFSYPAPWNEHIDERDAIHPVGNNTEAETTLRRA